MGNESASDAGMAEGEHSRSRRRSLDTGRAHCPQGRPVRRPPKQSAADGLRRMSELDAPDGPLLVDQLRFMARRWPDEVAYRDLDAGRELSFRTWDERSNQLARWLVQNGVERQERVAIYMDSDQC